MATRTESLEPGTLGKHGPGPRHRPYEVAGAKKHQHRLQPRRLSPSSYRTGQSGVAAARQEAIKEGKYSEAAAAKGIRFIPFAMETYGKLGTKALRLLRTLGQDLADSNQPSALRPWHARSFMDSAVQRLSVALQRTIQRDQVLRSHLRPAASAARRRAAG